MIRRGVNWEVLNSWGSMFNREYGDPSISKLLQLVVSIV